MAGALGRWALAAAISVAPSVCLADDGGFWPSWLTVPWSGGAAPVTNSARDPAQSTRPTKDSEKIVKLPATAAEVDCPEVDISDGGATARVGGPDSQSVRYQFDITDVARECDPQGGQFALKIGVAGRLLIGPAGSPGAYSSTLHVTVKREADGKPVFAKTLNVAVNTEGAAQAPFRIVTEPVLLPLTRAHLDDDYSIEIGLGGGSGGKAAHPRRARHKG
jgi:hypothetical protein